MKKLILLLFLSVGLNAQFNYQAIVKDNDGNVMMNADIKLKFSVMYQSSTATPVFIEEHDITTPTDGVVNLSVGGGTVVNGTFSDIDWSQNVFMKEELDTGSGYQDMGTKQIASVPITEFAKKVENIDFGNNNISILGLNSFNALGGGNIAIWGLNSLEQGNTNIGIGIASLGSLISGQKNTAVGESALRNSLTSSNTAFGFLAGSNLDHVDSNSNTFIGANSNTEAGISLVNSTAIGADASVTSSNTIQLGNADVTLVNTSGIISATGLNIGGTAITSTASELNLLDGVSAIGVLASVTENSNTGVRLSSSNASNHGDIGGDAIDLSKQGQTSTTRGATGYGSFASGYNTTASEYYSTALGSYTVASAYGSTAIGRFTTASGYYSVAMGHSTTASDWGSLVIGRYNSSGSSPTSADSFSASNPAFVIGNGTASSARSDAFKVMYNGDTTASGQVSATSFKGNADEVTLTYSGTLTNVLAVINDLKSQIETLKQSNSSSPTISFLTNYNNRYFSYSSGSSTILIKFNIGETFMTFFTPSDEGCYNPQSEYKIGYNSYPTSSTITSIERNEKNNLILKIIYSSGETKTLEFDTNQTGNNTFKVYGVVNGAETDVVMTLLENAPNLCP